MVLLFLVHRSLFYLYSVRCKKNFLKIFRILQWIIFKVFSSTEYLGYEFCVLLVSPLYSCLNSIQTLFLSTDRSLDVLCPPPASRVIFESSFSMHHSSRDSCVSLSLRFGAQQDSIQSISALPRHVGIFLLHFIPGLRCTKTT